MPVCRAREPSAPNQDLRYIVGGIIAKHDLRQRTRAGQLVIVNEYLDAARVRREQEIAVRKLIHGRHANRGSTAAARREAQYLDKLGERTELPARIRVGYDVGWLAHMARIRGRLDVPLLIAVHVLAELGWRQCEIANALDEDARIIRRLLARAVV
jgi:hypothetical protein